VNRPLAYSWTVTRSLVLCVCFVDRCLSFYRFSFGHCVVCSSSIYGLKLPFWYLSCFLVGTMEYSFRKKRHRGPLFVICFYSGKLHYMYPNVFMKSSFNNRFITKLDEYNLNHTSINAFPFNHIKIKMIYRFVLIFLWETSDIWQSLNNECFILQYLML
jgi:hypothetical protein